MISATLAGSASQHMGPNSSTVWRHLLWKDFRQVWQLMIGIAIIQASLQLLMGLLEQLGPHDMQNISQSAINIALAAPTLLAIACTGILIGQERQTGCWTWSSSLPVSWRWALISKVVIWLGASIAILPILLGVSAIALGMNGKSLGNELFAETAGAAWTYLMTLTIAVQVFLYFSIAALLIKDTLLSLVIAAIGLFAFHSVVVLVNITDISSSLNGRAINVNHEFAIILAYLASFFIGTICLAATFRWRWGAGQNAALPALSRLAHDGYVRPQRAAWRAYAGSMAQPSESWMLFQHGLQTALGLRAATFGGALLMVALSTVNPHTAPLGSMAACLAACLLGVSVFSGEQTLSRYRFFADRGVIWWKFLLSHLLPPLTLAFICVMLAVAVEKESRQSTYLGICMAIFVVSGLTSLVFPSPIIAITVSIVAFFAAFVFSISTMIIWDVVAPSFPLYSIILWWTISALIVIVEIIWLVPRWLAKDRLNANGVYAITILAAGLLPCVLGLSLGFLQIPKVAWQGTPLEQIKPLNWSGGPKLLTGAVLFTERSELSSALDWTESLQVRPLSPRIRSEIKQREEEQGGTVETWLTNQLALLEAIEDHADEPNSESQYVNAPANLATHLVNSELNGMLEKSAVVALMATHQRQSELAIRAWKANRKLVAFCQQPALQAATMRSIAFVWELWNTLDDEDLQFLIDTKEISNLTPVPRPTLQEFRAVLRARATLLHIMSDSRQSAIDLSKFGTYVTSWPGLTGFEFYPPIRWAYERQRALALAHDLGESVNLGNVSDSTWAYRFRDVLSRDYSLLFSLEEKFRERLSKLQNAGQVNK